LRDSIALSANLQRNGADEAARLFNTGSA